jgi:hypothetical protein
MASTMTQVHTSCSPSLSRREHQPQTMELVLILGEELSDCSNGSAREVNANATNGDARSIDGLLCKVRATWTRY